jgi:hypothetical protein
MEPCRWKKYRKVVVSVVGLVVIGLMASSNVIRVLSMGDDDHPFRNGIVVEGQNSLHFGRLSSKVVFFNDTTAHQSTSTRQKRRTTARKQRILETRASLPPLDTLLSMTNDTILDTADVQFLLDFVYIGHSKCVSYVSFHHGTKKHQPSQNGMQQKTLLERHDCLVPCSAPLASRI